MSVKQCAHLVLACLLLAQSVSGLAGAMPMSGPGEGAAAVASGGERGGEDSRDKPGCHDAAATPSAAPMASCCDALDQPCCDLGCAASAPAIPAGAPYQWRAGEPAQFTAQAAPRPDGQPSRLFRPPRSN